MPFESLSAFVDGELDPHDELELRRHLDGCAQCRSLVESLLGVKEVVASTAEIRPVPHSLRQQVNELASRHKPRKMPRARWWAVFAAAASLLVWIGTARWLSHSPSSSPELFAKALVADHVRYLGVPDAIQVASDDPRRIAESFAARLGFAAKLPQLSNASLLGGRFCWLRGHKALLSFYEYRGKRFSLFVFNPNVLPSAKLRGDQCRSVGEYQVCLLPHDTELLAMVADKEEARAFMRDLATFQPETEAPRTPN
jgi:anti-sigma factor RsiW